jgi:hypothetical protein
VSKPEIKFDRIKRGYTFRSTVTADLSTIDIFFTLFDAVRQMVNGWMSQAAGKDKLRIYISLRNFSHEEPDISDVCEECGAVVMNYLCRCGPSRDRYEQIINRPPVDVR